MSLWRYDRIFYTLSVGYFLALALLLWTTPLSPSEAKLFYEGSTTPTVWIARTLHHWLPGVLGLRLFPYLLGLINAGLYWSIVRDYFTREEDARFAFFLYLLLPGVIASGILLNEATYAFTMVLLFLWAYRRRIFWLQGLALAILLPSPTATFALYGMIALYGYRKGERVLLWLGLLFLLGSLLLGSYDFRGRPQGHFLELLGVYAALFSPFYFIYYFYALYRVSLEGPRDLHWYIASGALILSILLSIRQQILIVDFSPYLLAGAMIPVAVYLRSLRVRIRPFQRTYRAAASFVIFTMILSALLLFLHRPIYRLLGSPHWFFASALYEPYDLATRLQKGGEVYTLSNLKKKERKVLRFYGISDKRKSQ
ncbi:hypothetical protein [Nitratifractor sp.]|uniref:hypothetical protein n=1 Tax=Nitratifractor sp. TaxID=2268144 RepID=UPI0025D6FB34|nr:hypothetical protein [Nitratifractor sp.]